MSRGRDLWWQERLLVARERETPNSQSRLCASCSREIQGLRQLRAGLARPSPARWGCRTGKWLAGERATQKGRWAG